MARTVAQPQPAQTGDLLARLVALPGTLPGISRAKSPAIDRAISRRPWLMESVSWGGVALSAVLAGVGVVGLVGFESTLAKIGSGILLGGTVLTEIAAARLPVHAQRRFAEGGWLKGSIVVFGFGALTAWNVIAGHFGMVAIDAASVNDVRAPLERAAAVADAQRETAEEALSAFDMEAQREAEMVGLALRGAFESGYVTAAGRSARETSADRAERRVPLAQAVTDARAADRAAEHALEAAPKPRPDHELWIFSIILELCKGALTWFATGTERRRPKGAAAGDPLSDVRRLADMTPAERRAIAKRAASVLAENRHLQAALG